MLVNRYNVRFTRVRYLFLNHKVFKSTNRHRTQTCYFSDLQWLATNPPHASVERMERWLDPVVRLLVQDSHSRLLDDHWKIFVISISNIFSKSIKFCKTVMFSVNLRRQWVFICYLIRQLDIWITITEFRYVLRYQSKNY